MKPLSLLFQVVADGAAREMAAVLDDVSLSDAEKRRKVALLDKKMREELEQVGGVVLTTPRNLHYFDTIDYYCSVLSMSASTSEPLLALFLQLFLAGGLPFLVFGVHPCFRVFFAYYLLAGWSDSQLKTGESL